MAAVGYCAGDVDGGIHTRAHERRAFMHAHQRELSAQHGPLKHIPLTTSVSKRTNVNHRRSLRTNCLLDAEAYAC